MGIKNAHFEEKDLREKLDALRAEQAKIAAVIKTRAKFGRVGEIEELFLEAATRDTEFAKDRGIVHDVREAKVPEGAPIFQLGFARE